MDQRSLQRARRTPAQQPAGEILDGEYEDDMWPSRLPSSARRYHSDVKMEIGHAASDVQPMTQRTYRGAKSAVPARSAVTRAGRRPAVDTEDIEPVRYGSGNGSGKHMHWLFYVGLGLIIMLVGWLVMTTVTNWWQVTQDDWQFGRPRTAQYDMVVGHGDSKSNPSHFIALNLNRHVQVIEFPGGDSTKVKIYVGPILTGQNQDLAPVTLSFKDLNADGKLDMIINVQQSHFVFINDSGQFRPLRPGENITPPN